MLQSPALSLLDDALAKVNVKLGKLKPSSKPTANETENAQPPLFDGKLKNNNPTCKSTCKSFFPPLALPKEVDYQFDSFELGLTQDQVSPTTTIKQLMITFTIFSLIEWINNPA
jgi:hypothetical protein